MLLVCTTNGNAQTGHCEPVGIPRSGRIIRLSTIFRRFSVSDSSSQHTTWSSAHDLALIFIALAYGTDAELSSDEIDHLTHAVSTWLPETDASSIKEIVLEALAIFDHDASGEEVVKSIENLGLKLEPAARRRALEDAMRVAEADGLLLSSERTLLRVLAAAWDLRDLGDELVEQSQAQIDDRPMWSLLHDIALLAIAVAHGSTGTLDGVEIDSMVSRLSGWRVDLDSDDLRSILGAALTTYGSSELKEAIHRSAVSINERLPHSLRLIVLDDLITVAESDGPMNPVEKDMIGSLAQAWQLEVRFQA